MLCPYSSVRVNPISQKNILTPCGKCIVCRVNYRLPWEYRLYQELRNNDYTGSFVTMTYSDDKYNVNFGLNYQHIKTYYDELRKEGLHFKYFTVGEYGEQSARCHWHSLMFGIPINAKPLLFKYWSKWCYEPNFIVSPITTSRIRYCLKYLDKEACSVSNWEENSKVYQFEFLLDSCKLMYNERGFQRPRSYCSKGLGKTNYIDNFKSLYSFGAFRSGSHFYKPSKYQIDCLSRSDLFFQSRRENFKDESVYFQNLKSMYKTDYEVNKQEMFKSINFLKNQQLLDIQQGNHVKFVIDSDFIKPQFNYEYNFNEDSIKKLKQSCFNRQSVIKDLAILASS